MERSLPFQPADRRHSTGWLLSLGLHVAVGLAALWYVAVRPVLTPPAPFLPVELVTVQPAPRPDARPDTRMGAPAPRASAPRTAALPPRSSTQPAEDALTARLEALSRLRAPDGPLRLGGSGGAGGGGGGSASLADFIRAQIMRRWLPDLAGGRGRPVRLRVTVTDRGVFSDVAILGNWDSDSDPFYRSMASGARNAARLTSPVAMPPGNWPKATVLTITLNPRDASR